MNIDIGYSIIQTSDGGYLIAGMRSSGYPWVIKTSTFGEVVWEKTFFRQAGPSSAFIEIIKGNGDNYVVVGTVWFFTRDVVCVKLGEDGDVLWNKTYGGNLTEFGKNIIKASDNGYIIGGIKKSATIYDIWLIRIQ